jgi:hypothetical protein
MGTERIRVSHTFIDNILEEEHVSAETQIILKKDVKTTNQWMDCPEIEKGFTIANAKFKYEYSFFYRELRKLALMLYFMLTDLDIQYVRQMMMSAKKQAHYCGAIVIALDQKKLDNEFIKMFQKNADAIHRRLDTINRITKEDIHLTEYEPFFESEEFAQINDEVDFREVGNMAREWNKTHREIVEAHIQAIKPELDRHNKFLEEKKAKIKAEKEARKQAKKEQAEYEKEIIRNREKNRKEYKRLEREFERYYNGMA